MTITKFLKARIAEDEERARDFEHTQALSMNGDFGNYEAVHGASAAWATIERIGFPPARVLAECAAKRAILTEHEITMINGTRWGCKADGFGMDRCRTLRALAAVYADHPDYDPSWI